MLLFFFEKKKCKCNLNERLTVEERNNSLIISLRAVYLKSFQLSVLLKILAYCCTLKDFSYYHVKLNEFIILEKQ